MARLYGGKWIPETQAIFQYLPVVHVLTIERLATRCHSCCDDAGVVEGQLMSLSDQSGLIMDGFREWDDLAKAPYQFQELRDLVPAHFELASRNCFGLEIRQRRV